MDQSATFPDFQAYNFDGQTAFDMIIASSPYKSVVQAVASLSVFSHLGTVVQTGGKAVGPVIRNLAFRGTTAEINGRMLGMDDNKAPTDAFLWCNGLVRRPPEVQFNHVYTDSQNPDAYTSLANICMTPSFMAKLTDTHPEVRRLLRFRVWELYAWRPEKQPVPEEPVGYGSLVWAPTLPLRDAGANFRMIMAKRPKDRTTRFAQTLGTIFDGYRQTDAPPS